MTTQTIYHRRSTLTRALTALLALILTATTAFAAGDEPLPRSTPEEQGMRSSDVMKFLDELITGREGAEIHSVMVLRHGKVIAEAYPAPFTSGYAQTLYSASKTFTAAAVGLAVESNLLRVTDRVGAILAGDMPKSVSPELAELTVHDLLTMASGIVPDWTMRNNHRNWVNTWLSKPVSKPGEHFAYDSMDTYVLSAIVQKVTGQTVMDYLREKLFEPMSVTDAEWEQSPEGITTGGWGLYVRPEVMAKFGQLLLDEGRWGDRQLLPAEWVKLMMTPHRRANPTTNYGYQMWECEHDGAWRADGAYGQYIVVCPRQDMVVVITECSSLGGGKNLAPIREYLTSKVTDIPMEPGEEAALLAERQGNYTLRIAAGTRSNRAGSALQGHTFTLPDNSLEWRSVTFRFLADRLVLNIVTSAGKRYDIECGNGRWLTVHTNVCPPYSIKAVDRFRGLTHYFAVSGSYGWLQDGTLTMHIVYPSWITAAYITFNPLTRSMTVKENYQTKPYTLRVTAAK